MAGHTQAVLSYPDRDVGTGGIVIERVLGHAGHRIVIFRKQPIIVTTATGLGRCALIPRVAIGSRF
jgi:hypothetical protein